MIREQGILVTDICKLLLIASLGIDLASLFSKSYLTLNHH